jgi:metal-responsive CopG/Arc/MetJ family transcriptional regulator
MISFPDEFLQQVDALAEAEQRTRSELVREALRQYIDARRNAVRPGDRPQVRAAVDALTLVAQTSPGTGEDSTEDVRYLRDRRR